MLKHEKETSLPLGLQVLWVFSDVDEAHSEVGESPSYLQIEVPPESCEGLRNQSPLHYPVPWWKT